MPLHSWSFCLGLRNVYLIIPNRCNKWMNIVWPLRVDYLCIMCNVGTAVAQWLRCCATNRKVTGSIPAGVIGIFH